MASHRVLTDEERRRRNTGWLFTAVALVLIGTWGWFAKDADRIPGAAVALLAFAGVILVVALRAALRRRDFLDVDLEARTYTLTRNGRPGGSGDLDSLGPLEVKQRTRHVGSGGRRRTIIRFAVTTRAHNKLDFYALNTSGQARLEMEALARKWRLPSRSLGGKVREADVLDVPLHERLRDDADARKPVALDPASGVHIEARPQGYAMRSTVRSYVPLVPSGIFLAVALFAGFGPLRAVPEMLEDDLGRVLAALLGVGTLFVLMVVGAGVRDAFFPGTVHITDRGVRYRGHRMRFGEIEEVTSGYPIELLGDRRILKLAETFCRVGYNEAVSHELQRLIIEVAERSPQPAFYSSRTA